MPAISPVPLKRLALASICTATALALTACGPLGRAGQEGGQKSKGSQESATSGPYAGLSGPEVFNKSVTATKKATSLRLAVTTRTPEGPVKAHLAVDTKGDCAGTISLGPAGTTELIKTGDTVYLRFDEAMLRQETKDRPKEETKAVLDTLLGKWVEEKADAEDAKDLVQFCDLDSYLEAFEANDNAARRSGESTVNGTPTVVLTESHRDEKVTAHVAAEGTPFLLKVHTSGGDEPLDLVLSEFGKPVPAKKPAARDIVDVN